MVGLSKIIKPLEQALVSRTLDQVIRIINEKIHWYIKHALYFVFNQADLALVWVSELLSQPQLETLRLEKETVRN